MIVIGNNKIIKVVERHSDRYVGFDMVTESYDEIRKADCVELTESVAHELFSNDSLRFRIASDFSEDTKRVSEILGTTRRTYYRMSKMDKA